MSDIVTRYLAAPLAASLAAAQAELATATGPVIWVLPTGTHVLAGPLALGRPGIDLSIEGAEDCTLDLGGAALAITGATIALSCVSASAVLTGIGSQAWAAGESCNRACLESFVDRYLDAVVADQPSMVPLAPSVRFTEDGVQLVIGDASLASLRLSGIFWANDPEAFVRLLGEGMAVRAERRDDGIVLRR